MSTFSISNSPIFDSVKIITPSIFRDDRGEFVETYSMNTYDLRDHSGNSIMFKEDDLSISHKGVLRGLHGDTKTWKLIQCVYGEVFFALVDYNPGSPTFLKHQAFTLNEENRLQILVPPYFVNGYLCISGKCVFSYKQSETYTGMQNQVAMRWNDPRVAIAWPESNPVLSKRDAGI